MIKAFWPSDKHPIQYNSYLLSYGSIKSSLVSLQENNQIVTNFMTKKYV